MSFPRHRFSSSSLIAAATLAAVALTLTGCALDATDTASSSGSANITGLIHGGPNPVANATVTLYATQSNGYGGAGMQLGASTTSAADGSFSFNASSYTCPAGQQAYVVSAGGNTGANAANANSLLIAAIGPCANLTAGTSVWIDEASTIAAAYALSNFITISGATVNISATTTNNAASGTGTCTTVSGVTTTCTAAGLAHAFLNAANLVSASNSNGLSSTAPTGQAYSSPPSNPTTSSTPVAQQNVVPQQEIDSLANAVQACVNSTGTTSSSDTTSGCGQLFTATTIPTTISANSAYTTKPTNTLQALINLAKFPFANSSSIYNLAQTSGFYQPTLTAAPQDFSIGIIWRSYPGTNAQQQMGSVYYTTLDINDNVYATALTAPTTGSVAGAAPVIANALTSDGNGLWSNGTATISANTTNVCNVYAGTALNDPPCMATTDTLGHLWAAIGQSQSSQSGVFTTGYLAQISTVSGVVTQFTVPNANDDPLGLAIDKSNDVFFSTSNVSGTDNLYELPQGSTSSTAPTAVTFAGTAYQGAHSLGSLAFDQSGNIWGSHNSGSGTGYIFGADTGTFPAEVFGSAVADCNNCTGGGIGSEGTNSEPSASAIDASGNYWFTGKNGLYEVPAGGGAGAGTGSTAYTLGTSGQQQMRLLSMDGAGTIFVPDSGSSGPANPLGPPVEPSPLLRIFYPSFPTQLTVAINGCNTGGATGNAACVTTNPNAPNNQMFYQAFNAAIDATGSLWVSSGGNDGVIQIIGTAAPTWPQTSYLKPAVMP